MLLIILYTHTAEYMDPQCSTSRVYTLEHLGLHDGVVGISPCQIVLCALFYKFVSYIDNIIKNPDASWINLQSSWVIWYLRNIWRTHKNSYTTCTYNTYLHVWHHLLDTSIMNLFNDTWDPRTINDAHGCSCCLTFKLSSRSPRLPTQRRQRRGKNVFTEDQVIVSTIW